MNIAALRDVLTDRLSTYINDPQLDVRVVAYRSKRVYVVGEVNKPGVLPLDDVPLTIADAISLSGGLTENAHKSGEIGGVNQLSANSGAIYVVRGTDKDKPEIFHPDARYASGMLLAERFDLEAQAPCECDRW